MNYDFTSIIDRHGKDAVAVDGLGKEKYYAPDPPQEGFDVIPMWIADMNFPTVPTYQKRSSQGQNTSLRIFFTEKRVL